MKSRRMAGLVAAGVVAAGAVSHWAAAQTQAQAQASASPAMPAYVSAAVGDPVRPAADRVRDADRKPAEVIAFAGIKPGDTVADMLPGGGYFTRIFAKVAGPGGRVDAVVPSAMLTRVPGAADAVRAIAASPGYRNVSVLVEPLGQLAAHGPYDVVWTAQNYHDLHNTALPAGAAAQVDKSVFAALKPGGVYLVEDHAATAGSGDRDSSSLHRIDEATVKSEVEAAGFTLEAQSPVLQNPRDDHTLKVFDPAIRGRTDQFVLKFRKPG